VYSGVLSGTSLDPSELRYVFKMVKLLKSSDNAQSNGQTADEYAGHGESHVMSFDMSDVADFNVNNVVLDKTQAKGQNGSAGFRTDTDISGHLAMRERKLQAFDFGEGDTSLELGSGGVGGWDQFATNDRLTGKKSNYDETIYTTAINRSDPEYAKRAARADRIAREIESSAATNSHIREERASYNPLDDQDLDEEDKYGDPMKDSGYCTDNHPDTAVSAEDSHLCPAVKRTSTHRLRDELRVQTRPSLAYPSTLRSYPPQSLALTPQLQRPRNRPPLPLPKSPPPLCLLRPQRCPLNQRRPKKHPLRPRTRSLLLHLSLKSPPPPPSQQSQQFPLARLQSPTTLPPTSSTTSSTRSRRSLPLRSSACLSANGTSRARTRL
jgi:hypothetical protein